MATVSVFAYGSLAEEPEHPEHIAGTRLAQLVGYRRTFHKLSRARGTHADHGFYDAPVPSLFRDGDKRFSLALGAVPAATHVMEGVLVCYRTSEVLSTIDIREGHQADGGGAYHRRTENVVTDAGAEAAEIYLTQDAHADVLAETLDLVTVAQVLTSATPRAIGSRASGIDYLRLARLGLARMGRRDAYLEAVAEQVRRLGPEPAARLDR